jgi:hypothetical protein
MSTIIKIKNSGISGSPSALATGELAYSYLTGTLSNGGDRLYIGTGAEDAGAAANIEVIGGTYFTSKLDHTPGTLTSSSALIVDADSKIDIFNVDNLRLDGNTLSSTNINGDINLSAAGTGDINLSTLGDIVLSSANISFNGTFNQTGDLEVDGSISATGDLGVEGQTTLATLNVEDLTATRIVFVGEDGQLVDSANLTFDGTSLIVGANKFTVAHATGNTQIVGTLNVDGQTTLASVNIEDLTTGRVTFAGTDGELVDSSKFTFNSATDTLGLTGVLSVTGSVDVDNLNLNGNTISATNSNGNVELTPNALGLTVINSSTALVIPTGNTASRPGAPATGMIRYNTTDLRYEGYSSGAWQGLGGVVDVDQDTYIRAESSPGADNDDIEIYTGGVKRINIDENGMVFTDTSIPLQVGKIQISDDTIRTLSGGVLYLDPNPDGAAGSVVIEGNLTINGTTTTVNSTVVTVDDPIFILGGDTDLSAPDGMDKGILFKWHDGVDAKDGFFGYDTSAGRFTFIEDATNASEVISGLAADVKFGNALLDSMSFTAGNYLTKSVMGIDTNGDVVFYEGDTANVYGVEGQVLQMNSSGVPTFGHIDCGTY